MSLSPKIALLSPAVGTGNVGDYLIEEAIRRLLAEDVVYQRYGIRRPLADSEIEAINGCDCALICGTNLYQRDWQPALTAEVLDRIHVPVIPFGVGASARVLADTDMGAATERLIRAFHAHCALGSVRDPYTATVVANAGVDNFVLTGCSVLFWAGRRVLPEIQPIPRQRIIVTARNWLMHRWPDNVDHPVQLEFLRCVLKSFPTEQLVFAVHEKFDANLIEPLKIPQQIVFRSAQPRDYVDLYTNQNHIVLASRLHAGMLALSNGVPAVFVGHDTRTYSFCQMLGLTYVELFSDSCADKCVTALQELLHGGVACFAPTHASFARLRRNMDEFLYRNKLPVRSTVTPPVAKAGAT